MMNISDATHVSILPVSRSKWTVSYTHLDVYKRQRANSKPPLSNKGGTKNKKQYTLLSGKRCIYTVSYTHLDVYKRQELEELMEIKQLIQRQKIERMMKVHKEMRGLDRYLSLIHI